MILSGLSPVTGQGEKDRIDFSDLSTSQIDHTLGARSNKLWIPSDQIEGVQRSIVGKLQSAVTTWCQCLGLGYTYGRCTFEKDPDKYSIAAYKNLCGCSETLPNEKGDVLEKGQCLKDYESGVCRSNTQQHVLKCMFEKLNQDDVRLPKTPEEAKDWFDSNVDELMDLSHTKKPFCKTNWERWENVWKEIELKSNAGNNPTATKCLEHQAKITKAKEIIQLMAKKEEKDRKDAKAMTHMKKLRAQIGGFWGGKNH